MPYSCFFLEPTDMDRLSLRRYDGDVKDCPRSLASTGHLTYCNAQSFVADVPKRRTPEGYISSEIYSEYRLPNGDPRYPQACECGRPFGPKTDYQLFIDKLYRRTDTGETMPLRDAPPGALWICDWDFGHYWSGPDGLTVFCKTPGGDWCIDSRSSNCTMPQDDGHRCWVRHGDPRDPRGLKTGQPLHVDKNGATCQAGAGSILCGAYHGFLHNGMLTDHC